MSTPASTQADSPARDLSAAPRLTYPTPHALWLAGAAVVVAIVLGLVAPGRWPLGFLCAAFAGLTVVADLALSRRVADLTLEVVAPTILAQGSDAEVTVRAAFSSDRPPALESALTAGERLAVSPHRAGLRAGSATFRLRALRRGRAAIGPVQMRWSGPLGLVRRQYDLPLDRELVVTPDLGPARAASRTLNVDAMGGPRLNVRRGHGGEFRALRAYVPGDDRRVIDWKRSASRGALLVKEFQLEQNHPVVLAIDCGRTMVEPIEGRPRIDHAVSSALALAYAGLTVGDRLKLCGFDAKVAVDGPFVSGRAGFASLQAAGSRLDYSTEATNFTLALHTIATGLDRRSLVVIFTEFTDAVGAELMLESVGRLVRRHVVMFVVFRDAELKALVAAEPREPPDVARAVVAASLLKERALVLEQLKRLGVRAVETTPQRMGGEVIDAYLDLKRRELG